MNSSSDIQVHNPVHLALDAYKAAVHAKDVAAFAALYDTNVRVFDLWGTWRYEGLAAWREMAQGWFGSLGSERVVVEFDEVVATVTPELAVGHAFVTYRAVDSEGAELRALNNRLTLVLQRREGGWKIVHEHTSGPVDHETAKVMLKR